MYLATIQSLTGSNYPINKIVVVENLHLALSIIAREPMVILNTKCLEHLEDINALCDNGGTEILNLEVLYEEGVKVGYDELINTEVLNDVMEYMKTFLNGESS